MKHIIFFLLFPVFAYSQGGTWPVKYNDSDPSGTPSAAGTRLHFNTATNTLWFWEPAPSSTWRKQPKAFDQISGCAAPAYTPTARQSTFAVNSCTVPELYQWTGAAWVRLNEGEVYTAGTGIAISGGNVISNTGDLSTTNELNTSLSVTGGNLRLTDAGGNLDVPVSSIAPVQAVSAGTGISVSGTTTRTITNTAPDQTVAISAGTGIGVTGTYPNFTIASTITQADGSETKINVGTGLSKSGSGTTGSPYVLTNTAPDQTVAISAGTGIGVSGTYPNFTVTNSAPGVANDALGTGFTAGGGSGTIPDGTIANRGDLSLRFGVDDFDNEFGVLYNTSPVLSSLKVGEAGIDFRAGYDDGVNPPNLTSFVIEPSSATFTANNTNLGFSAKSDGTITFSEGTATLQFSSASHRVIFDDQRDPGLQLGIEYAADYSATILTNDRSIPDVGTTKQLISSENGALGTGFTGGGGEGFVPDQATMQLQTGGSFGNRQVRMLFGKPNYYQENYADGFPSFGMDDYDPDLNITAFMGFSGEAAGQFNFGAYDFNTGIQTSFYASPGYLSFESARTDLSMTGETGGGIIITDSRLSKKGMVYAADYSTTIKSNDRSVPDVGTVNILKQTPVSYTNAAAPNNTIFYSTTDSKLSYKDPGGTVHGLY